MIKENEGDSFRGAGVMVQDPYDVGDCAKYPTLAKFLEWANTTGRGYTFRKGFLFVGATLVEVLSACTLPSLPEITNAVPHDMVEPDDCVITGSNFGGAAGKVWLTNSVGWGASTIFVEQSVQAWAAGQITVHALAGALPPNPAVVYLYVERATGQRNLVGHPQTVVGP